MEDESQSGTRNNPNNLPVLAIWRGHEIGIIKPTAILRVRNHSVPLFASTFKVVLLEVTCFLGEAIPNITIRTNEQPEEKEKRTCRGHHGTCYSCKTTA